MLKILITILLILLAHTSFAVQDGLNRKIIEDIRIGHYDHALELYSKQKAKMSKSHKIVQLDLETIELLGRIFLRIKKDPDLAITFFKDTLQTKNLTDAEFDLIRAWLGIAIEWKNSNTNKINDPKILFDLGKKYFESGIKRQKYIMDISASADFSLSINYLLPFTIYFDSNPNIGDALYMMGEIRRRSWHKNDYWTENFYLMEVIRRFPNTELSAKAYQALEEDVHYGYTGSSGDNTPASWLTLLKELKAIASIKKSNNEPTNSVF